MSLLRQIACGVLLMGVAPGSVFAAAELLYVRPSADCPNNGTGSAYTCAASGGAPGAWNSLASVTFNASDETAGSVDAGDTLYACGSFAVADRDTANYFSFFDVSGASANGVTLDGDCSAFGGSTTATFNGGASTLYGIGTAANTYLTIQNIALTGFTSRGLILYSHSVNDVVIDKHLTISDVTIEEIRGGSALCVDSRGKNISFTALTISGCGVDGIWHNGAELTVSNVSIERISMDAGNDGDGIQLSGTLGGAVLRDLTIDMTSVDSKYCIISQPSDTGAMLFTHNTCRRNTTDVIGSGMRLECPTGMRCEVTANDITGGELGLHIVNGGGEIIAAGNLIRGNTHDCISSGGTGSGSTTIDHNTCDAFERDGILQSNANVTAIIQNNIVHGGLDCIDKMSDDTERYNLVSGCVTPVANSGVSTTIGTGDITSDPLFLSGIDWRLSLTSPARAVAALSAYCVDVRGRTCPSDRHHIGAYQSTSGDPAATRSARN